MPHASLPSKKTRTSGRISQKRRRDETELDTDQDWVRCICGVTEDDGDEGTPWVACDQCHVWLHQACVGIKQDEEPPEYFLCHHCDPASFAPSTLPVQMDRLGEIDEPETESVQEHGSTSFPLTDECQHYAELSEVPWDLQKYWKQRRKIFSRYNSGIRLTNDLWYGVTPEPVARYLAQDLVRRSPKKRILVDLFAGAGGNTIAFAMTHHYDRIFAIDVSAAALACASHNAAIYNVQSRITFIQDDCIAWLASALQKGTIVPSETIVFASPPWGGPSYTADDVFDVESMEPLGLRSIVNACRGIEACLYLPRTSDLNQLAEYARDGAKLDAVQLCMDGASKAMAFYVPAASAET